MMKKYVIGISIILAAVVLVILFLVPKKEPPISIERLDDNTTQVRVDMAQKLDNKNFVMSYSGQFQAKKDAESGGYVIQDITDNVFSCTKGHVQDSFLNVGELETDFQEGGYISLRQPMELLKNGVAIAPLEVSLEFLLDPDSGELTVLSSSFQKLPHTVLQTDFYQITLPYRITSERGDDGSITLYRSGTEIGGITSIPYKNADRLWADFDSGFYAYEEIAALAALAAGRERTDYMASSANGILTISTVNDDGSNPVRHNLFPKWGKFDDLYLKEGSPLTPEEEQLLLDTFSSKVNESMGVIAKIQGKCAGGNLLFYCTAAFDKTETSGYSIHTAPPPQFRLVNAKPGYTADPIGEVEIDTQRDGSVFVHQTMILRYIDGTAIDIGTVALTAKYFPNDKTGEYDSASGELQLLGLPSVLGLINAQNGASIDLGMKREDAEESALSYEENPIESPFKSLFHVSYGKSMENRIDITYNSDQVIVSYSVGGHGAGEGDGEIVQDHSIWRLNGISLDSSIHDAVNALGWPTSAQASKELLDEDGNVLVNAGPMTLNYYFDAENELLTASSSRKPSSRLVLHFENGKLSRIEAALEDIS